MQEPNLKVSGAIQRRTVARAAVRTMNTAAEILVDPSGLSAECLDRMAQEVTRELAPMGNRVTGFLANSVDANPGQASFLMVPAGPRRYLVFGTEYA